MLPWLPPFPVEKTWDESRHPRDDIGRWKAGGGSTHDRLRSALAHVGTFDAGDISHHRGLADHAVAELRGMSQADVYRHLLAAGLDGIRPGDSKGAMLKRLHDRLTARVRARERAEV